jgi:hypothetical protein
MKFVGNRSFLLLKPKKPFVKWVNGYDGNKVPEDIILSTKTLYMINDIEDDSPSEIEKLIKTKYEDIFLHELWSWYTDKDYLPKNISVEMFNEWFEYEFIEMCFDTLEGKIILE